MRNLRWRYVASIVAALLAVRGLLSSCGVRAGFLLSSCGLGSRAQGLCSLRHAGSLIEARELGSGAQA